MAQVFLAVAYGASGFEKRIALKTLLPELRGNAQYERLLIDEAKLGARLLHRNLLGVHELGVDAGVYYIRMDYVDGADLASLSLSKVARAPLSEPLALLVAEEVCLALEYVHGFRDEDGRALGLIHRDVSPGNILISREGEVKLADFGVHKATMLEEITQANVRKGKYAYMSPEQIGGEPLSAQSDQFSLGVTLWELLLGRRPFEGDTPFATMESIRQATPPDASAFSPGVRELLVRCLAKSPGGRFPSTAALRQAIALCRQKHAPVGAPDLGAWLRGALT
jgi:serine/threonine-protein kinase